MHQYSEANLLSYTTYLHPKTTKWVTLIHGAGGSSIIWFRQIKFLNAHYNVLLIDLRGHGNSKHKPTTNSLTFDEVVQDIIDVLNHLKIASSHFIGISLGTIIIRQLAATHAKRVDGLIMAGAIMQLNIRSQLLMQLGMFSKSFIPYMWLYRFFAFIIMPRHNHKKSRAMFIREAKKLTQQEFIRWYRLSTQVNTVLKKLRSNIAAMPCLYLMGKEDAMFLPSIQKLVTKQPINNKLIVVPNCGHVVNIDQPDLFNNYTIAFLNTIG